MFPILNKYVASDCKFSKYYENEGIKNNLTQATKKSSR